MNKATISVWFRVPSATAAIVQARDPYPLATNGTFVMDHVIPILMFGSQQTSVEYDFFTGEIGTCHGDGDSTLTIEGHYVTGNHAVNVQPSCIGVQCYPAQSPTLYVHIQSANGAVCANTEENGGPGFTCGTGPIASGSADISDASYVDNLPQYAYLGNSNAALSKNGNANQPTITLDVWHHLLISWDLQTEAASGVKPSPAQDGISTYSKMYCALDDVNLSGSNLPATWVGVDSGSFGDANAVVSSITYYVAKQFPSNDIGATSSSLEWGTIPSSPLSIPGPTSLQTSDDRGEIVANQQID